MKGAAVQRRDVEAFVRRKLDGLLRLGDGARRAALANLRRGAGRAPGDLPSLWGTIFDGMPENMAGSGAAPSRAEWAVYIALTLYALHQQGRDPAREPMNAEGAGMGRAAAQMVRDEGDMNRVLRRFNETATSSGMEELEHHLRGLVNMLRAEGIPLDYQQLAGELFAYQSPEQAAQVRLAWGRDFYRYAGRSRQENEEENDNGQ